MSERQEISLDFCEVSINLAFWGTHVLWDVALASNSWGGEAGNVPFSVWIANGGVPASQRWSGALCLLKGAPSPRQACGTDQMALLSHMLMNYLCPRRHFQEMRNLLVLSPTGASFWLLSLVSDSRLVEAETRQKFGGVGGRNEGSKLRVYREKSLIFKNLIFRSALWSMFECYLCEK